MGLIEGMTGAARPVNGIMAAAAVWIGWVVTVQDPDPFEIPLLLAMLSVFSILSGGNMINDVLDRRLDIEVHPGRPLVTGKATVSELRIGAVLMWTVALFAAGAASMMRDVWYPILMVDLAMFSLIMYELYFKRTPLAGNLLVSLLVGSLFVFGGTLSGVLEPLVIIFSLLAASANLSREIAKDMEDVEGDRRERNTFPLVRGMDNAASLVRFSIFFCIAIGILPLITEGFNPMYLVIVAISDLFFIISAVVVGRDPGRAQSISKTGMLFALLAFLSFSLV